MVDYINEINRLVLAFASLLRTGPEQYISINSLLYQFSQVVIGGRLPDHHQTIILGQNLGLVNVVDDSICLTADGTAFLEMNSDSTYELTESQRKLLVKKYYLEGVFSQTCRNIFKCFSLSSETERLSWSSIDDQALPTDPWVIEHLVQLEVIIRQEDTLVVSDVYHDLVVSILEQPKGMTEEMLRKLLKEKEEVGELAESVVLEFEKNRLVALGNIVEAHCIRRVSKTRVNAGFDIESFDQASNNMKFDRYIEVKGAKQKDVRFFWSENEIQIAKKLGDKYWIYFQGGINAKEKSVSVAPLLFQNPIETVLNNPDLERTTQGLLVQGKLKGKML